MSKKLYIIDSIDGVSINSSCHVSELMPYIEDISNIEVTHYDLKMDHMIHAINDVNDNADIVFILHDFRLWNKANYDVDYGMFERFLRSLWNNKNIFVFPTEMASSGLVKSQFKENASLMTKIIVGSESFRKMFLKIDAGLAVPANRIKFINMPTDEHKPTDNTKMKREMRLNSKVVFTPGKIHPSKDYITLLRNFKSVLQKHKNVLYVISLKKHHTISKELAWKQFDEMQDFVEANKMQDFVRLTLDKSTKVEYTQMMKLADLVLFPQDNSLDMYNGCMLDALAMGKAIVTPESTFADDLVKKTSILLYKYEDEVSFYDACSVVLENKDFREILQKHNYEYGQVLSYTRIAQQYVNQIKRFKFN